MSQLQIDLEGIHKMWETRDGKLVFISATVAVLFGIYYWAGKRKTRNLHLPPELPTLPIIGALGHAYQDPDNLLEIKKKYGNIFGWHSFGRYFVVISSYELIREAFVYTRNSGEPLTVSRPANALRNLIRAGPGLTFATGQTWHEHRGFVMHRLRDLGFGRVEAQENIKEQADWLCELLLKEGQGPATEGPSGKTPTLVEFNPRLCFVRAINNVVSRMAYDQLCSTEPAFEEVVTRTSNYIEFFNELNESMIKLLLRIPVLIPKFIRVLKYARAFNRYMWAKLREHEKEVTDDVTPENARCLLDAYISEKRKQDKKYGPGKHTFTDGQIVEISKTMFLGGTETTSNTLRWAIVLMARYPHFQRKAQEEIANVIGDNMPNLIDRLKLPYTEAVMSEVQRFVSIVPLSVPHMVSEPCQVHGYDLPVGTIVYPNLYAVHRDSTIWPEPNRFDPEANFLGGKTNVHLDGNVLDDSFQNEFGKYQVKGLMRSEYLIPFGVGKRDCPGEGLARAELFLFFVRMLQKFEIRPPKAGRDALTETPYITSPARLPPPFKVIFAPR